MSKIKIIVDMPEDAYLALSSSGYSKARISTEAKKFLAAHLFQNGLLSLGKASEVAGVNLGTFIDFLDKLKIPVIDYDEDELEAEFNILKYDRINT
ncbi:MAG TPA: UPF0175 family protein [Candidatus Wolfebacteria bacterium]|nr:UPF0175 family protein [Candidatus Wolfebacteria bacterium]